MTPFPFSFDQKCGADITKIIGAPAFFPTVWGWIKRWFDPITTSKIFILSHHDLLPTLEAFIEPANIPKKYGGQLDYTFGDKPVIDPAMEKFITWEGDRKEFPSGPMYWLNSNGEKGRAGKEGFDMEALAVGADKGMERREKVCKISTRFPVTATEMNGHADATQEQVEKKLALSRDLLTAPTEVDLPSTIQSEIPSKPTEEGKEENLAIQEGTLIPASRPEPVTFVTATEDISLNEKVPLPNGEVKHQTRAANLLDPSLAPVTNGVGKEDAHQHHAASDTDLAVGGGVEEADVAHNGLVDRVKEKIGVSA